MNNNINNKITMVENNTIKYYKNIVTSIVGFENNILQQKQYKE